MKLYNSLTRTNEEFKPLQDRQVGLYSCGPTVYNHIHLGNLSAFIAADTLRRTLTLADYKVQHVMNFTDVDDKTISRSQEQYPDLDPQEALQTLTRHYEDIFLDDMRAIGNDVDAIKFIRATETIAEMQHLIRELYAKKIAYIADDGVYFSIEAYKKCGKKYGQLVELEAASTSNARINNDEYDKDSAHDFALWKLQKDGEPTWEFELDGHILLGRPGWHIECSAMSHKELGLPFDIHTGGIDLKFPHHENEIAQSTGAEESAIFAKYFVHNEHLLVDGRKMSKSLNNFYTLQDVREHSYEPLAFRLMVLQAHYRSQTNFTWENLAAAQNRLQSLRNIAVLRWQASISETIECNFQDIANKALDSLTDDLHTPQALAIIYALDAFKEVCISKSQLSGFEMLLKFIDAAFGLDLMQQTDITDDQKMLIADRQAARTNQDWPKSDELRGQLEAQGIGVRDTSKGPIWYRL